MSPSAPGLPIQFQTARFGPVLHRRGHLLTVSDADGLSYYSETSVQRWLHLDAAALRHARHQLRQADLLAYAAPLYQLLSLPREQTVAAAPRANNVVSVGQVLRQLLGGTQP